MWKSIKRFRARYPLHSEILVVIICNILIVNLLLLGGVESYRVFSIVFFPNLGGSIYYIRKYMKGDDLRDDD